MNMKKACPETSVQWFQALLYLGIVDLILTIIRLVISVPSDVAWYISIGLRVSMMICLFQLAPFHPRYKKAAILHLFMLISTFIEAFLSDISVIGWLPILFLTLGRYQEYTGHSEYIADKDTKLSSRWNSLFKWELVAGVLLTVLTFFVSTAFVIVYKINYILKNVVNIMSIPMCVFDVLYLVFMNRLISRIDDREVT